MKHLGYIALTLVVTAFLAAAVILAINGIKGWYWMMILGAMWSYSKSSCDCDKKEKE